MTERRQRIAIVGCGAVSEVFHLPAATRSERSEVTLLVDKNLARAEELARRHDVEHVSDDHAALHEYADAAIVALPHHLHAPVSIDLLSRGIHVLVEKPMALSASQCEAMIGAAEEARAVLTVGLMRRLLHSSQWAKGVLDAGILGPIESFDFEDGSPSKWPATSDFSLRKETAGGGVLINNGVHTLDLLLWWLGKVDGLEYHDDSRGGVEANCALQLRMASGARGIVELSKTRSLRNTAIVRGKAGEIEVGLHFNRLDATPKKILTHRHGTIRGDRLPEQSMEECYQRLFERQLNDWLLAIAGSQPPHVTGREGARSVALAERCYTRRQPLALPWIEHAPARHASDVPPPRISSTHQRALVTGATGCIGGRLTEKLYLDHDVELRVLARDFARAANIARFPLEIVHGDIADADAIDSAVADCRVVFHCAHDFRHPARNLEAARLLAQACMRHDVERLVHISTHAVYGTRLDGFVDEETPAHPSGWEYADNKLAVEEELFRNVRVNGLRLVVLQPTVVYGPFSNWTIGPVNWLSTHRLVLPDQGEGLCHAVYVDDVVDALILAAHREDAEGQRFLIAGPAPVTWREFYSAYEQMLGVRSVTFMPTERIEQMISDEGSTPPSIHLRDDPRRALFGLASSRWRPVRAMYELARRLMPRSMRQKAKSSLPAPLMLPDERRLAAYRSRSRVRTEKAQRVLDFTPAFDFTHGMELTERYIRWANLDG